MLKALIRRSGLLLLLLSSVVTVSGCDAPLQTTRNPPAPIVPWVTPSIGMEYYFQNTSIDSLHPTLDSNGSITPQLWLDTLRFLRTRDFDNPPIRAEQFSYQAGISHSTRFISRDSLGNFWLGDSNRVGLKWSKYPGLDPTTQLPNPPITLHERDTSFNLIGPGFIAYVDSEIFSCLGTEVLIVGGTSYNTTVIRETQYQREATGSPNQNFGTIRTDTYWIAPTIGCFVREHFDATGPNSTIPPSGYSWQLDLIRRK